MKNRKKNDLASSKKIKLRLGKRDEKFTLPEPTD